MILVNRNLLLVLGILVSLFLPPLVGVISGVALIFNRDARLIGWAMLAVAVLVWSYNFIALDLF